MLLAFLSLVAGCVEDATTTSPASIGELTSEPSGNEFLIDLKPMLAEADAMWGWIVPQSDAQVVTIRGSVGFGVGYDARPNSCVAMMMHDSVATWSIGNDHPTIAESTSGLTGAAIVQNSFGLSLGPMGLPGSGLFALAIDGASGDDAPNIEEAALLSDAPFTFRVLATADVTCMHDLSDFPEGEYRQGLWVAKDGKDLSITWAQERAALIWLVTESDIAYSVRITSADETLWEHTKTLNGRTEEQRGYYLVEARSAGLELPEFRGGPDSYISVMHLPIPLDIIPQLARTGYYTVLEVPGTDPSVRS